MERKKLKIEALDGYAQFFYLDYCLGNIDSFLNPGKLF